MPLLRISKKHHKHVNNPFPPSSNSLPYIHGTLSFDPNYFDPYQTFPIGENFYLSWNTENGGQLSISHNSQPSRSLWSTVPGEAFISTAAVQTEVEESRGSFVISDGDVLFMCKHQSVEDIRVIHELDARTKVKDNSLLSEIFGLSSIDDTKFPVVLITGCVFNKNSGTRRVNKVLYLEIISLNLVGLVNLQ